MAWKVESFRGWHLTLLEDPSFLPLRPLLQRALLLALPERLWSNLAQRGAIAPEVLVALQKEGSGRHHILGLIITRRLNRSGTCRGVDHLRLALTSSPGASQQEVAAALLREAIQRAHGATSWIATASSLDCDRLATLREQGFQPQRTDRLWCWQPEDAAMPRPPADLMLLPLNRRSVALLWHLEQATCPAQLRQLLDRRPEDLLDHSGDCGWILIEPGRNAAVAGVRWQAAHPDGGQEVELSLHPGWRHLLGPATELLLRRMAADGKPLWLAADVEDTDLQSWLELLGAEAKGERVLMARSVWRRQERQPALRATSRLEAVLEQLQPRRSPLPTPLGQR